MEEKKAEVYNTEHTVAKLFIFAPFINFIHSLYLHNS